MTKYANHPRLPSIVNVMAEGYFDRAKAAEREQMAAVGFEVYTDEVIMHGRPDAIKRYYQQAARKWEIIVDRFPDAPIVPQAYERAAVCYGYVNDYRRAMECAAAIVDRYPEYVSRDRALFMIGRMCERLRDQGVLTDAEAIPTVLAMSQAILSQYPQSHLAVAAQRVVDRAVETETRERKESTDDTQ
jgi:outer membrane protein assembly factor BamD (BamD/ComL family)